MFIYYAKLTKKRNAYQKMEGKRNVSFASKKNWIYGPFLFQ